MMPLRRFIPEMLKDINDDPTCIERYKINAALRILMEYAFLPEKKFCLPEGKPPFKEDSAPLGMSPGNFVQELRRLYIFTPARELNQVRRETLFIQLLESLHPSEANILVAVKDQNLRELYPNITVKLLVDNGLLPEVALETAAETEAPKRKRGRPAKNSGS